MLGGVLHFTIAFAIVSAYFLASRRAPVLIRDAIALGMLFGIAVYSVMTYVVISVSEATRGSCSVPVFVNGILIHVFGVGLPAARFARAATNDRP